MAINYVLPKNWIQYDITAVVNSLVNARASLQALTTIPYQKRWAEELQVVQLKREVAGTSRIEGADFTERELDEAIKENIDQLSTRSQRQAAATVKAYRWIAKLENDRPVSEDLIREIHSLIIKDADDDHCEPGVLRKHDQNVIFGNPLHRGCEGGEQCSAAFTLLSQAMSREFQGHDILIQALAAHYHFAAMHPFLDGNGRTARALEAFILQRVGLKDSLFIAMSNYYYEEKNEYLKALAQVRAEPHNLTPFLLFGLKGIDLQCRRLFGEIKKNISKALFKEIMYDLFVRMQTPKKRVIAERQIEILKVLLEGSHTLTNLDKKMSPFYKDLSNPSKALIRDLNYLLKLEAIGFTKNDDTYNLFVRLEWPTEITESEFFKRIKQLPKAKTESFL